ncbi:MAG: RNA polymerase sigma-70 factor [Chitinophaga rupis]
MQESQSYDDKLLFGRIATGDEAAFKLLFDKYKVRFYAASLKMTRSSTLSEEIVQEIFMTLWLRRAGLPEIDNPYSYLFTMVYNSVYAHFRRIALEKQMQHTMGERAAERSDETEEWLDARESRQWVEEAIRQLPPQQQNVYRLSREAGMSREEIARQLGISPHTVKNHLQEALKSIRAHLQRMAGLAVVLSLWHR